MFIYSSLNPEKNYTFELENCKENLLIFLDFESFIELDGPKIKINLSENSANYFYRH